MKNKGQCTLNTKCFPYCNFSGRHLTICALLLVHRKLCCAAVKSLFLNEGKHGGEATIEAVQMIADLVKAHNCQLQPDSIEVRSCLILSPALNLLFAISME